MGSCHAKPADPKSPPLETVFHSNLNSGLDLIMGMCIGKGSCHAIPSDPKPSPLYREKFSLRFKFQI